MVLIGLPQSYNNAFGWIVMKHNWMVIIFQESRIWVNSLISIRQISIAILLLSSAYLYTRKQSQALGSLNQDLSSLILLWYLRKRTISFHHLDRNLALRLNLHLSKEITVNSHLHAQLSEICMSQGKSTLINYINNTL